MQLIKLFTFIPFADVVIFITTFHVFYCIATEEITLKTTNELPQPILTHDTGTRSSYIEENNDSLRNGRSQRLTLMDIALQASAQEGLNGIAEFYGKTLPQIIRNGQLLAENHPAAMLSKFSAPSEDSERIEMAGFANILTTKAFRKNYKYINELARHAHTPKISLRRTALEALCPPREPPLCMPASHRYRTHDGTCNNIRRPRWGASQMPFNRFLPPEYGDGVDSIRNSVEGGPLSSSRFVSLLVHGAKDGEAPLTLMSVQWGQLLDHDLTSTAQPRSINGSVPSCCGSSDFHPSCFSIKVPLDDPWLAPLKVRCLEFLRSAPAQRRDCILSWREQTNQATSYIDASPIYSNSAKLSDNARVFRKGLLIYGRGSPTQDLCHHGAIESKCIRSGDGRSSEQPGLLALHLVWVGEHNRIAMELSEMNVHWSDEKIYQETRRIVGAMFQHITYREFLPVILGKEVCKLFDLELLNSSYFEGYDNKINPTVANSFAAAAFRFGHSLVQGSYIRCDRHHNMISNNVSLHEEFQHGDIGSAGSLHRLIRGMAWQRALKRDEFITPELTNHLFQTPGFPFGLDLAAINIQRGRDHGIAPYTSWRVPCGLSPVNNWDDFSNVVGPESARRISHAYRSVHDIDLFVGGIAERPVVGGLVGPTFACIIAQQFSNSRKGDRFWYENGGFESSFTPAQLHAIRRVSLAQVLCRTVGDGTFQPHIFIPPEFPGNNRQPCGSGNLAPIDLSPWLEQDPFAEPPSFPLSLMSTERIPDLVFDILPTGDMTTNGLTTIQVTKENKANLHNQTKPIKLSIPSSHVEFISNSANGIENPQNAHTKNTTKVSDKLDIRIKGSINTVTRRPAHTVIRGINNKLDKDMTHMTVNIKTVNRHKNPTTTRRTVIVNNVPMELRTVTSPNSDITKEIKIPIMDKTKKRKPTKRTKIKNKKNKPEARLEDDRINNVTNKLLNDDDNFDLTNEEDTTVQEENIFDIFFTLTEPTINTNTTIPRDPSDITEKSKQMDNVECTTIKTETTMDKSMIEILNTTTRMELTTTNLSASIDKDIDPMTHSPGIENKRVQRTIDENKTSLQTAQNNNKRIPTVNKSTVSKHLHKTNLTATNIGTKIFLRNKNDNITAPITKSQSSEVHNKTITSSIRSSTRRPTRSSNPTKTTSHNNIELRQYHTQPIYTRPHKVIVDGPNSDQYEIEINIRQTNKSPALRPNTNYAEYTTVNNVPSYSQSQHHNYDRYPSQHRPNYPTSTQHNPYYQALPTLSPHITHNHHTKPPTIIYLNEHDYRTTTRQPGFIQNLFTFASNGLSGNRQPFPPITNQKEKPSYIINSPHSSVSSSHEYNQRPQTVSSSSSYSHIDAQLGSGLLHASSGAVSSDSTFSFNIKPKPMTNGQNIADKYGLIPPDFSNLPVSNAHIDTYYENASPFSTANKKPNYSHTSSLTHQSNYYTRTNDANPLREELVVEPHEYDDYISRTLEPTLQNARVKEKAKNNNRDIDYQYGDYDENSTENVFKIKLTPVPHNPYFNVTILDDNYVLPALNGHDTELPIEVTKFLNALINPTEQILQDSIQKHLHNNILAEDNKFIEDIELDKTIARTERTNDHPLRNNKILQVPFAPIRILTKPERPDKWILFDTADEKSLLPDLPSFTSTDSLPAAEIPKPIQRMSNIRLTNNIIKDKIPLTVTSTDDNSSIETKL